MSHSPIHVHVKDNTPVHLHVKKTKPSRSSDRQPPNASNRSNKATAKCRSRAINGPWIPAPAKTSTRDRNSYKWDTARSQLEINHPENDVALRMDDLSTDEEERVRSHIKNYEQKIDDLMKQVGTLKNESVKLQSEITRLDSKGSGRSQRKSLSCGSADKRYFTHERPEEVKVRDVTNHNLVLVSNMKDVSLNKDKHANTKRKDLFRQNNSDPDLLSCITEYRQDKIIEAEQNTRKNKRKVEINDRDDVIYYDSSARIDFSKLIEDWCESESSESAEIIEKLTNEEQKETEPAVIGKENVDTMQNTVKLQQVEKELQEKTDELAESRKSLEDRRAEMDAVTRDFEATERENLRLLQSMEMSGNRTPEHRLTKALIEVEMDGQSVAQQINVLRGLLHNLSSKPGPADMATIVKERESLMQKFTKLELSNRDLRKLLQDEHESTMETQRLSEQRDTLMRKMSESDVEIARLRKEMLEQRNALDQAVDQLNEEKKHGHTLTELNKSIDATRAHLQRELRAKEMENNRLHVQLVNMEKETSAVRLEAESEISAAKLSRETITGEKEALKRATRLQKQKAERAEIDRRELEQKLAECNTMLTEAREDVETWKSRYHRAMDDRARSDTECKNLRSKLDEAESNRQDGSKRAMNREADLTEQLHKITSENSTNRLDAERLRGELATANQKLRKLEEESALRRSETKQWETLTSELRTNIARHKNEAEEALLTAERVEREARRMRQEGAEEIEKVRKQMLDRMRDLHPLPDLLKETEMKLQDAQEQISVYERRAKEQSKAIAELTTKAEDRTDEAATLRQKLSALSDENRALEARLEIVRTKLDDRDHDMRESAIDRINKDKDIQTLQLKYDEKCHEITSLQRQLDVAINDARRAGELERDNVAARERASQSRIVDLETQVTRLKTEILNQRKSKEDSDRRLQSQLHDAQDRLQQSESTNRSMRNYVSFLKSSYSSVFGDSPQKSPSSPY